FQRDAAVVGAGERRFAVLRGQRVEARGDAFDATAAVGKDDRGTMLTNLVGQEAEDRRPDAALGLPAELLDRHDDAEVEVLAQPGVHDGGGARRQPAVSIDVTSAEEAGDFFEWALRGGQADPHIPLR